MRQEKWLLVGLAFVFSACSSAKDAPSGTGGSDAQAGTGGHAAGGGGGRGNLDALAAGDVPILPRTDGALDVPSGSGCSSNLECSGRADNLKVCSQPTRECVECLTSSDCSPGTDASVPGRECVKNVCLTRPACTNSLDCPAGNVCDRANGVCVQCAANTDCTAEQICAAGACRKRCASDIECTPLRLLCETRLGYCASCVLDTDCPASQFCSQGECLRDLCVPGTTKCQNNAVVTCNAAGSTWVSPVACKTNQSCRDTGSAGICMDRVCTPSAKTCSSEGEKAVSCSADGLTSTVVEDCAASGKVCAAGVCAAVACTAGARFCQGVEVRQCSAKGESSTLVASCTAAQYCDGATNTCKARVCTPNQPACNGTVATTCDAVGAATLPGGTDCATQSLICSQGKCQTYVCSANSLYCDAGTVRQCSADGLTSTLVKTCSGSQYCDKGSCKAQVCQPNQPICNGKVATTCNADGSAILAGGTDCSLTNQGCSVGLCKDQVCTPSTYFCGENNTIMYCASTGLSASTYQTCLTSQYCDAGACKTQVCSPGLPTCNLKVATTCNAKGSGYEAGGTDCAATNQACVSGECKDMACTPSTYLCKDGSVHLCSTTGMSSSVYDTCTSTEYCDAAARICKARVCTPGAAVCNSNVATICNSNGSGYEPGGTTCSTTQTCVSGVCQDHVCPPSTYLCKGNAVYYCASNGLSSSLSSPCSTTTQYCDEVSKTCKPRVCTPNQPACTTNNVGGTCNQDGSGIVADGPDCAALTKVCSAGACGDSALDTIENLGMTSYSRTTLMTFNLYSVNSPRTLLKIEQYLKAPVGATLTWSIYSATTKTSTAYTLVTSKTSTAMGGTLAQYESSGELTGVQLESGKFYAIAVTWGASTVTYYYHSPTGYLPISTSFGALEAANSLVTPVTSVGYPGSTSGSYYPQRLTTGP